jgi:hypothetical protein
MKKLMIAALLLSATQPAFAADFAGTETQQMGAFGGLSLRIPLDGRGRDRQVRAGLAFAPMLQSRAQDGAIRTRIGDGLELGVSGRLSLAGRDVRRLAARDGEDDGGIPTGAWIAGGLVVASLAFIGFVAIVHEGGSD